MCTALVALSLVPLIGWAGQVSLAPLAFAGIGAVAYARLGGVHGNGYAVIVASLVVVPVGALLALPALRLQGLYLALATLVVRVAGGARVLHCSRSRSGPRAAPAGRLQLFGMHFDGTRDVPAPRHRGVRARRASAWSRSRRGAFGRRLDRAPRQRSRGGDASA